MPMPCTCALRTAMPEVDVDVDVDGDADDEDLEFDVDGAVDDGVGDDDLTRCGPPRSFSKEPATALLQIGSRRRSRWTPGVSRTHPTSVHRP